MASTPSLDRAAFEAWRSSPESLAAVEEITRRWQAFADSPQCRGWMRLFELLGEAKTDPVVALSPAAQEFAALMQRRAGDSLEHETAAQTMKAMHADLSKGGGGRPTNRETWDAWKVRYEELRRTRPSLTAEERYEEIASEWEQAGHKPVTWRGVKNGISKLKTRKE